MKMSMLLSVFFCCCFFLVVSPVFVGFYFECVWGFYSVFPYDSLKQAHIFSFEYNGDIIKDRSMQ